MANPKKFLHTVFPPISSLPQNAITCIGINIEGNNDEWLSLLYPFTTPQEHVYAEKFLHKIDAIRHLLPRAILRKCLQIPVGDFSFTEFGKPYLPNKNIFFNVSHSGNMVWVALCFCAEVGIDVEEIRPLKDMLSLLCPLHDNEQTLLKNYVVDTEVVDIELEKHANSLLFQDTRSKAEGVIQAFYRCWTRKEALSKACGLGLHLPLNSYEVDIYKKADSWIKQYPKDLPHHLSIDYKVPWSSYDLENINMYNTYSCSVVALAPQLTHFVIQI